MRSMGTKNRVDVSGESISTVVVSDEVFSRIVGRMHEVLSAADLDVLTGIAWVLSKQRKKSAATEKCA